MLYIQNTHRNKILAALLKKAKIGTVAHGFLLFLDLCPQILKALFSTTVLSQLHVNFLGLEAFLLRCDSDLETSSRYTQHSLQ